MRNSRKRFAEAEVNKLIPNIRGLITFAICEGRLAAVRVVLIFLAGHLSGSVIGFLGELLAGGVEEI